MEDTFRNKLYTVLCINGGISDRAVRLMSGSQNYKLKTVSTLKKRNILEKHDGMKRFTKEMLDSIQFVNKLPEEYRGQVQESSRACRNDAQAQRHRYQSEMLAVMLETGVHIWEGEPSLIPENIVYVRSSKIKEMKRGADGDRQAARRSRVLGTVFAGSQRLFSIYAMDDGLLKWESAGELSYKYYTENLSMKRYGAHCSAEAVVFCDALDSISRFLHNKRTHTGVMRAGDIYSSMYILPKNETGTRIFGLLLIPESRRVIRQMAGEGNGNLNLIIPDAARLYSYRLEQMNGRKKGGCIHCLEGYEEGIRAAVPGAGIVTHSINSVTSAVLGAVRSEKPEGCRA